MKLTKRNRPVPSEIVLSGLPLIVIATLVSMIILPIAFPFFP